MPGQSADDALPLEEWDWGAIVTLERRWLEKHYRKPRCRICDGPLVCGQADAHMTCERVESALHSRP